MKIKKPYDLKIQSLNNKWHDKDEVLLHACFQCLVDYMEKEDPDELIEWDHSEAHKKAWEELVDLYHWWKNIRPFRLSILETTDIPDDYMEFVKSEEEYRQIVFNRDKYPWVDDVFDKSTEQESQWTEEDTINLKRLIDVREFMWT